MGLIMLGTASERVIDEMLSYARETQHEKIIRSLAVGIAFVMYGKREAADGVINELIKGKVSCLPIGLGRRSRPGRHLAIRRDVHDRSRLRRNGQQQGDPKVAARRRLGCRRRCATSSCHRARLCAVPQPHAGSSSRSASCGELQPARSTWSDAGLGYLVCRHWSRGGSLGSEVSRRLTRSPPSSCLSR